VPFFLQKKHISTKKINVWIAAENCR